MYVPCNKINNQTYTCTKRYKEQICMYASAVEICMLHPKEVVEKKQYMLHAIREIMILKQVRSTVKKCPEETLVDMYNYGYARHYIQNCRTKLQWFVRRKVHG